MSCTWITWQHIFSHRISYRLYQIVLSLENIYDLSPLFCFCNLFKILNVAFNQILSVVFAVSRTWKYKRTLTMQKYKSIICHTRVAAGSRVEYQQTVRLWLSVSTDILWVLLVCVCVFMHVCVYLYIGDSHRVNCSGSHILPTISCKSCSTRYKLTQMFDLEVQRKLLQKRKTEGGEKEKKRVWGKIMSAFVHMLVCVNEKRDSKAREWIQFMKYISQVCKLESGGIITEECSSCCDCEHTNCPSHTQAHIDQ